MTDVSSPLSLIEELLRFCHCSEFTGLDFNQQPPRCVINEAADRLAELEAKLKPRNTRRASVAVFKRLAELEGQQRELKEYCDDADAAFQEESMGEGAVYTSEIRRIINGGKA